MAQAFCLGLHGKDWKRICINAAFSPGTGNIQVLGPIGQDFPVTIHAALAALSLKAPERVFSAQDLTIHIDAGEVPLVGDSYGLALCVAVFAAAIRRPVPPIIFTGAVGPAGEVLPVGMIKEKRKAACALGYTSVMLPASQLDMRSILVNQIPVRSIYEAFSIIFDLDMKDAI